MRLVLLLLFLLTDALLARELTVELADLPPHITELRVTGRDELDGVVYTLVARPTASLRLKVPEGAAILRLEGLDGPDLVADFVTTLGPEPTLRPAFVDVRSGREHSFMVLGCNRLNQQDQSLTPSSANAAQLEADFAEVQPSLLFFTGDLVMAQDHAPLLEQQLREWQKLWERLGGQTRLVPMPGNHELLYWDDRLSAEIPDPPTGEVWSRLMAPWLGTDGPQLGLDDVQRDESRLSYTLRRGKSYYICVNTETWQGGLTAADTGRVPLRWLEGKLAAAESDASVEHIFVFGHKPVTVSNSDDPQPAINTSQASTFSELLSRSSKVRAYLCAHAHRWALGVIGRVPQLIAGNAGSSPDRAFTPGYYGYTMVHVLQSGDVAVESWGRPIPVPYSSQRVQPRSTVRERFTLYRKSRR